MTSENPDGNDGQAQRDLIRERALKALRLGRVEETEALLQSENLSVVQLTQDLLVHQAELEMQAEELWEANLQLQKAREKFSRFFRLLPHPAVTIDPVTATILDSNDIARMKFVLEGATQKSGALFRRLGQGRDSQDLLASAVAEAYSRGEARLTDVRLSTRSGNNLRGGVELVRVDDDSRGRAVILAVISDDTERQEKIDRLSSESRLEGAFASLLDLANRASLPLETVLAEAPDKFIDALGPGTPVSVRVRFGGRDYLSRGWHPYSVLHVQPIVSKSGESGTVEFYFEDGDGAMDLATDASTRLRQRICWLLADLLGRIIEDRRLRQTLETAERLAAAGQVASGIAHDFNNLLTVILGEAEILAESDRLPSDFREGAESILAASLEAARLTHYLLAYTRQQPLAPERVRPAALVAECLPRWRGLMDGGIMLLLDSSVGGWEIEADAGQLESAVLNLITNARDAISGEGKITICVRNLDVQQLQEMGLAPDHVAAVMVEVKDTGCGMTPEVLAKAQEPFFTTKQRGRGSGLGLSMITGFVQQTGGSINIVSSPGKGTCVRLFFPAALDSGV